MFDKFESLILQLIICLTVLEMNSCLKITQINVNPSLVMAPKGTILTCDLEKDNETDTFKYLYWYKLIDNDWKLIKAHPQPESAVVSEKIYGAPTPEGEGTEPEAKSEETPQPTEETTKDATESSSPTEPPKNEETPKPPETVEETAKPEETTEKKTTQKQIENTTPKPIEKKLVINRLIGLKEPNEGPDLEFIQTSQSSAGLYKCVFKSTKEINEMTGEMRVLYKPGEGSKPELNISQINDNHISVKCRAPASYPMTALNFFINYELASHEEVHPINTIKTKNTSYGPNEELLINVEELRIRATKHNVLNGNISIVCTAIFADIYHESTQLLIRFNGSLYSTSCLSAAVIVLIVLAIIILIIVIVAVVWIVLRKKKINSLNKVAELFNKQKTITVLVDNNTNDMKIE